MNRLLKEAATGLFNTLFPGECRLCGAALTNVARLPVCQSCLNGVKPLAGSFCSLCGEQMYAFGQQPEVAICGMCRRATPPFARAVAFGSYDGELRGVLHLLKYEQVRPAAALLGQYLAATIQQIEPAFSGGAPIVIPVPLHGRKRRQRGFNQAELIARAALKQLAARGVRFEIKPRLLKRQRATSSQTGLTRHQRRANLRGAFVVKDRATIAGRDILVVDDVFTTGTTVSECARLLMRAGARRVFVATVARVLKGEVSKVHEQAASPYKMAAAN
ncbi:MAG: ComF family protein [Acidobacteriales bacterium]|nr:ComF family protein [Terriglobales bacterium]